MYGSINYVSNDQYTGISNIVKYPFLSSIFEVDGIRYVPVSLSERTCDAIDCVYNESASITKVAPTVTYKGVTLTVQKIQPYICYNNKYINHLTMEVSGAISHNAFQGCSNMQTAILGTTNNEINKDKFTGIYIGSNITSIGDWVFYGCESLNKWNIADRESELTLGSNDNSPLKCGTPNIAYSGDKISFTCDTEGVKYIYRITGSDVKAGNGNEVGLQKKYTISVYATKEGYVDSDVAKSTFEIGGSGVFGDLTGDGVVNVADHVELSDIILNQNK